MNSPEDNQSKLFETSTPNRLKRDLHIMVVPASLIFIYSFFLSPDVYWTVDGCELTHDVMDIVTVDPYSRVYLPGQRVTLGCPDGYEFRGSTLWFCQTDFTWTENQAECIPLGKKGLPVGDYS